MAKQIYDQVRFIDETGMEVVRINYKGGSAEVVDSSKLQNKGKRYYFRDTFELPTGKTYISPFDLNIEHGSIEKPLKPMIRIATPVFDSAGNKRGIFILNYLGAELLEVLDTRPGEEDHIHWMVNKEGYWLRGPRSEEEWGFMYAGRKDSSFANDYPDAWAQMSNSSKGQFLAEEYILTYRSVYPLHQEHISGTGSRKARAPSTRLIPPEEYEWKVIHAFPLRLIDERANELLWIIVPIGVIMWSTLSLLVYTGLSARRERNEALVALETANTSLEETVQKRTLALNEAKIQLEWELFVTEHINTLSRRLLVSTPTPPLQELANIVLQTSREISHSKHGYVGEIDPSNGDLIAHTLTEMLPGECEIKAPEWKLRFQQDENGKYPSLWGHSLNTLEPFITNSPAEHPATRGVPKGHLHIRRLLSVPVLDDSSLLGQIAVSNSSGDYTDSDLSALEKVAVIYSIALKRRRAYEERKDLERQLLQSQKLEAIGTLAGGIAHDFNNILTPIIGYTEMAIEKMPTENLQDKSTIRSDLSEVLTAALRATDLVQQILTFSRPDGCGEPIPMLPQPIVKEALKLIKAAIPPGIEVKQDISSKRDYIYATPTQMHQIILNLCTNAIHSMEKAGKGKLSVTLDSITLGEVLPGLVQEIMPGPYVRIEIRDTGSGINESDMEKIFDPFFSTKPRGKGTGLGLSVVHGIMQSLRGGISLESAPGKGTVFTLYFPITEAKVMEEEAIATSLPYGNEHVLLVDDQEQVLRVVERELTRLGYKTTKTTSPSTALEYCRDPEKHFDILVTDYGMPEMNGIQLAEQVRKIDRAMPILLITGFSGGLLEQGHLPACIDGLIRKPSAINEIASTIRQVLSPPPSPSEDQIIA